MLVAAQEINAKALGTRGRNPHRATRRWHLVLVTEELEPLKLGDMPELPPPEQLDLWIGAPLAPLAIDGKVANECGYRQLEDVPRGSRCAVCSKLAKDRLGVDRPGPPPRDKKTWRY